MALLIIDTGPRVAYLDAKDDLHGPVKDFIGSFKGQFITTLPVITEAMWMLRSDHRVQNELSLLLTRELIKIENLTPSDFAFISEVNEKYRTLPADFADLTLLAISERFGIAQIFTLDSEFDIYMRSKNRKFVRVDPL